MRLRETSKSLLRLRGAAARVSNVELFFDLVFVYAVTQVSHILLRDLSFFGAVHATLLFLAVWWVWIYTSWVTNWLDPERTPVRILLFVLMLAGLVMSTSIPEAFGTRGTMFAGAYAFMQVGRSLFMVWALGRESPGNRRNFFRILVWLAAAAVFWLAGGLVPGSLRLGLWIAALGIEYLSAAVGFWTPGLGRSTTADWDVDGRHLAERCSLFIIIALGESLLVSGASFEHHAWTSLSAGVFGIAFLASVAMWWIYFDVGAERGSLQIARSEDPGRLARVGYTYLHLLIVAGIIVGAVADELLLAHPLGATDPKTAAVMVGAPALYLLGNILFKRSYLGWLPLSHLVGLGLLAALVPAAPHLAPIELYAGATAALVLVAVWERGSLHGWFS